MTDYFHTADQELNYQPRLYKYQRNLADKWKSLYEVYLKVKKELKKYKTISSFRLINEKDLIEFEKNISKLRSFEWGELQLALEPYIQEHKLEAREPVPSKKIRIITKKLVDEGWDAKETSVAEAFRKMGFVKGRRK